VPRDAAESAAKKDDVLIRVKGLYRDVDLSAWLEVGSYDIAVLREDAVGYIAIR
jgi:hypothetical protein